MPNMPPKKCSKESALIKIAIRFFGNGEENGWDRNLLTSTLPGAAIRNGQPQFVCDWRSKLITKGTLLDIGARTRQKGHETMPRAEVLPRKNTECMIADF